ncbi:hypothetical protein LRP30_28120 [Bradyrhizobium sp. C-145]|uniref:hypothetical protein n=1 Tax=Bradyrhizobium sp. C-145 TaxID=574727 RepID=UPI00201B5BC8|nr:hypothetical protein [Bradyrhizobium sp. C-145]UQR60842.1 hypothetical protein LRP30_28120 [Bradyrhizobium sp. C-145]
MERIPPHRLNLPWEHQGLPTLQDIPFGWLLGSTKSWKIFRLFLINLLNVARRTCVPGRWLFVFNSGILRTNQEDRSRREGYRLFGTPPSVHSKLSTYFLSISPGLAWWMKVRAEDMGEKSRRLRIEILPVPSASLLGGARPSRSDPAHAMALCRSRLLAAISISAAAALTLKDGFALAASHGRHLSKRTATATAQNLRKIAKLIPIPTPMPTPSLA